MTGGRSRATADTTSGRTPRVPGGRKAPRLPRRPTLRGVGRDGDLGRASCQRRLLPPDNQDAPTTWGCSSRTEEGSHPRRLGLRLAARPWRAFAPPCSAHAPHATASTVPGATGGGTARSPRTRPREEQWTSMPLPGHGSCPGPASSAREGAARCPPLAPSERLSTPRAPKGARGKRGTTHPARAETPSGRLRRGSDARGSCSRVVCIRLQKSTDRARRMEACASHFTRSGERAWTMRLNVTRPREGGGSARDRGTARRIEAEAHVTAARYRRGPRRRAGVVDGSRSWPGRQASLHGTPVKPASAHERSHAPRAIAGRRPGATRAVEVGGAEALGRQRRSEPAATRRSGSGDSESPGPPASTSGARATDRGARRKPRREAGSRRGAGARSRSHREAEVGREHRARAPHAVARPRAGG